MSACSFNKGKLTVLSYSHCPVGGRSFDEAITRHFCDEFRNTYKLDVMGNKKALLKLLLEAEKECGAFVITVN
jgi:molecular chaperone DnaK (HSP70)